MKPLSMEKEDVVNSMAMALVQQLGISVDALPLVQAALSRMWDPQLLQC